MKINTLTELGLSQNEAKIYEALLREGRARIADLSKTSGVHRRNIYDAIKRLSKKGLAFEVHSSKEVMYYPANPEKLLEIAEQKKEKIKETIPHLMELYSSKPQKESVYIHKGIQGYVNLINEVLKSESSICFLGTKGEMFDPRLQMTLENIIKKSTNSQEKVKFLFDFGVKNEIEFALKSLGGTHKFLSEKYSTTSSMVIYENSVATINNLQTAKISEETTLFITSNNQIAESCHNWFQCLWDNASYV